MIEKDNKESQERKNRKTAFERSNKKSRSSKDHLEQDNGERSSSNKPSDSKYYKGNW